MIHSNTNFAKNSGQSPLGQPKASSAKKPVHQDFSDDFRYRQTFQNFRNGPEIGMETNGSPGGVETRRYEVGQVFRRIMNKDGQADGGQGLSRIKTAKSMANQLQIQIPSQKQKNQGKSFRGFAFKKRRHIPVNPFHEQHSALDSLRSSNVKSFQGEGIPTMSMNNSRNHSHQNQQHILKSDRGRKNTFKVDNSFAYKSQNTNYQDHLNQVQNSPPQNSQKVMRPVLHQHRSKSQSASISGFNSPSNNDQYRHKQQQQQQQQQKQQQQNPGMFSRTRNSTHSNQYINQNLDLWSQEGSPRIGYDLFNAKTYDKPPLQNQKNFKKVGINHFENSSEHSLNSFLEVQVHKKIRASGHSSNIMDSKVQKKIFKNQEKKKNLMLLQKECNDLREEISSLGEQNLQLKMIAKEEKLKTSPSKINSANKNINNMKFSFQLGRAHQQSPKINQPTPYTDHMTKFIRSLRKKRAILEKQVRFRDQQIQGWVAQNNNIEGQNTKIRRRVYNLRTLLQTSNKYAEETQGLKQRIKKFKQELYDAEQASQMYEYRLKLEKEKHARNKLDTQIYQILMERNDHNMDKEYRLLKQKASITKKKINYYRNISYSDLFSLFFI